MITVTLAERATPKGLAPPDIAWAGTAGDFVADPVYGLVAENPIRSAIIMLLFTNCACAPAQLRFEHGGDRRGWAGDSFGLDPRKGAGALGSTLWLLRRQKLDARIAREAEIEAERALQPLIVQKIAVSISASGTIAGRGDRLDLGITLNARDGRPVYADRFDVLWKARA